MTAISQAELGKIAPFIQPTEVFRGLFPSRTEAIQEASRVKGRILLTDSGWVVVNMRKGGQE